MAKVLTAISQIKGMKQIDNPTVSLAPNYCTKIQNYYFNKGTLLMRSGLTKLNTGGALNGSVTAIHQALWDNGTSNYLISAGTKWYKTDDFVTNTEIETGLGTASPMDVTQFKVTTAHAIIASRGNVLRKYDNTTLSNLNSGFFSGATPLTLTTGDNNGYSIVRDSTNTYGYIACRLANALKIVKIDLLTMTEVATKSLSGVTYNLAESMVIDSTDTYLYIGCRGDWETAPYSSTVHRLTLADFTTVATKTLGANNIIPYSMAIDSTKTYLYIACAEQTSGHILITKLTLSDFTTTASKEITTAGTNPYSMVITSADTFLYIGTSSGYIAKLTLADFTTTSVLNLSATMTGINSMVLDNAGTYLYAGSGDSPGKIARVTISDFTTVAYKSLTTGSNIINGIVIDSSDTYLYATTYITTAIVYRLTLSDFTTTSTLTLQTGHDNLLNLIISPTDSFLYTVTDQTPSKVIKITTAFNPQFVETHMRKTWLFGFTDHVYRFYAYYSKTDDATDYTTANDAGYLDFGTVLTTYDTPTGMKSWGSYIAFFFSNNILIYQAGTNPNDFRLIQHIKNVGSLSNNILNVGNDLWFPTKWGIRSLKSTSTAMEITYATLSEDIDPFYVTNITNYATNLDRISLVYDKKRELILVLANASNSQATSFYVYNISDKAWTIYKCLGLGTGVDITCVHVNSAGNVYIGTSDGNIYELYSGTTDNSTAVEYIVNPVTQYFGNATLHKKIKYIRLGLLATLSSGSITYDVDKSNLARTVSSISKTISGTLGLGYTDLISIGHRGKSWDFSLTNCGNLREIIFYGEIQGEK